MRSKIIFLPLLLFTAWTASAGTTNEIRLKDLSLDKLQPAKAPATTQLLLKKGDRLAICGDSITEQKMYSRIMEDYLTMCVPELGVTVRQYGWSGERAPGFLARMTNDCLRFKPTVATTCYGMNDHEYRAYEDRIGDAYRENSRAIILAFKAVGARVVQGSPGCVGKVPGWRKPNSTVEEMDLNLCKLRNIGIELAEREHVAFADVFWPMLTAGIEAQKRYSPDYAIAGGDGVHPKWAGHAVMAYAFLKGLGLGGNLGTFTVDLGRRRMKATEGHEVISSEGMSWNLRSSRYPFCPCVLTAQKNLSYPICSNDDLKNDNTIRSAMTLVPFNEQLNRLTLIAKGGKANSYRITWGTETRTYSSKQLASGINLAADFNGSPFAEAFSRVDEAVIAKQTFETKQIKQDFRSAAAKADMETVVTKTEQEREPLAQAIKAAFVPVTHTLRIEPE